MHAVMYVLICHLVCATVHIGADPDNLRGRWLTGWLPMVNDTGASILKKLVKEVAATLSTYPPGSAPAIASLH